MMRRLQSLIRNSKRRRLAPAFVIVTSLISSFVLAFSLLLSPNTDSATSGFDAGSVESFERGSLRYFDKQHFYLIRQQEGSFLALYDWAPWPQRVYANGDKTKDRCRVQALSAGSDGSDYYQVKLNDIRRKYPSVPGLEMVVLVSGCDGSAFDPLGRFAFGPAGTDLDSFTTSVTRGRIVVNLAERQCQALSPCLTYR